MSKQQFVRPRGNLYRDNISGEIKPVESISYHEQNFDSGDDDKLNAHWNSIGDDTLHARGRVLIHVVGKGLKEEGGRRNAYIVVKKDDPIIGIGYDPVNIPAFIEVSERRVGAGLVLFKIDQKGMDGVWREIYRSQTPQEVMI